MAKNRQITRSSNSGKYVAANSPRLAKSNAVERIGSAKDQSKAGGGVTVRDAKTGRFLTVKGAGALKESGFAIKKSVDLTKPIARQALRSDSKRAS